MGCSAQVNPVHKNIGKPTVAEEQADTTKEKKPFTTYCWISFQQAQTGKKKMTTNIIIHFYATLLRMFSNPSSSPQTIRKKNKDEMTKWEEEKKNQS